jgi:hypothetical protein
MRKPNHLSTSKAALILFLTFGGVLLFYFFMFRRLYLSLPSLGPEMLISAGMIALGVTLYLTHKKFK